MVVASDIMTKEVISLDVKRGLDYLIKLMAESKVSSVLITENDLVIGIVTERDLIKKILLPRKDPSKLKLEDVMTKNVFSVRSDTPLYQISQIMKDRCIRHMPVIDDGKLKGMLTQTDIVKETHKIHKENIKIMNWQNIQSAIIILFFLFLILYIIYNLQFG
ncbi:MAG: CBS domain-containing protein [Candidatus Woesearchaeota archaeon]